MCSGRTGANAGRRQQGGAQHVSCPASGIAGPRSVVAGILLAGVFLSGCQAHPETRIDNPAFLVTVPEGWKSGKVKGPDNSGNFSRLGIPKTGAATLAEVNISWYEDTLDLRTTIAERMQGIEDARFFNVRFGDIVEGSYGRYDGLMARSNEKKWKVELQVEMYCFQANGKTFVVWTGGEGEDLQKYAQDVRLIESDFRVQ